ncbi:DUF1223 domain-containing protein [Chelatococcus reniformis]|nr:DUF1223 domain-containing protein [Chelatococcus reniformis]
MNGATPPRCPYSRRAALLAPLAVASLLSVAATSPALAADRQPTVVELFTSQGCSSCPPANANLAALSQRPGILALSFGVTYWDKLGWADTFARRDYTARQIAYEGPLGEDAPFTPQVVVNGRASIVGSDLAALEGLIAATPPRPQGAPDVSLRPAAVEVGASAAPAGGADVWLVRYDPHRVDVPVRRGENGGRTLPHKNVVRDLVRLGRWTGVPVTLPVTAAPAGLRTAVLVQVPAGGPILAAATD